MLCFLSIIILTNHREINSLNFMKSYFAFFLSIILSVPLSSKEMQYSLGGYLGLNRVRIMSGASWLDEAFEPNYRSNMGVSFALNIQKRLFIQADFAYEKKGTNLFDIIYYDPNTGNNTGIVTTQLRFDYLTFPILLNYKYLQAFVGSKAFNFNLGLGIYNSFLVRQSEMLRGDNIRDTFVGVSYIRPKKHDIGLSFNLGFNFQVTEKAEISLRVLNNIGVKNINPSDFFFGEEIYNNSYNLLLGFNYRFERKPKKIQTYNEQ